MKVWLVQRAEPTPHDDGGAQRAMRMGILAEMLVRNGHQVVWWTSTFDHHNRLHRHKNDVRLPVAVGYQIQYIRGCGYSRNMSFSRLRDNMLVARRFENLASREPEKPDILLASVPTAELAVASVNYGRLHGIPVVLDIRDLWPDVFVDLVPKALKPFVHLLSIPMKRKLNDACSGADGIIGLTEGFVEWGVAHAGRTWGDNDRVFPMAYLTDNISSSQVEKGKQFWKRLGVGTNSAELVITFLGRIGKCYDLLPVVQAARLLEYRHAPVKVIICGTGESMELLKKQAHGVTNMLLPGWVNAEQIRAILELADIGIAPYLEFSNFINNIPNKPAEYLSGGLGIALSLNRGALHDLLVERRCGFSYDNDGMRLADELERLAHDHNRLRIMQDNAVRAFRELLDGQVVYTHLIKYLEQMARSGPGVSL